MISFVHVCKSFGDVSLLQNLNLKLEDGQHYCLMSPSGSGKTTFLNLLCGLQRPDSGEVVVPEGTCFSYIFQEDRLLEHLTAAQNISLVSSVPTGEIEALLLESGLTAEDLQKPCSEYSGGMKRRVAILRALLAKWDVLLLDEPYKGLDSQTKNRVLSIVDRYTRGKITVLVTHDAREAEGRIPIFF